MKREGEIVKNYSSKTLQVHIKRLGYGTDVNIFSLWKNLTGALGETDTLPTRKDRVSSQITVIIRD